MKQSLSLQSLMESLRDAVEELNTTLRHQPKLFNVIQPFYSPGQSHSVAEAKNISVVNSSRLQSSEINANPETNNLDAVYSALQSSQITIVMKINTMLAHEIFFWDNKRIVFFY
jgi:hypothetical protein